MNKDFDILISDGVIYDGLGNEGQHLDIAIKGDKIYLRNIHQPASFLLISIYNAIVKIGAHFNDSSK